MGLRINTNIPAMQAQTSMNKTTRETTESFSKLASGERITKAADDAAGLAISEKLKANIRSSKQANRNANDGISMIQTAEGGLNESTSILTRMRELAIQAATDTLSAEQRSYTNLEYQGLKQELDRISLATQFNGKKLLDGSGPRMDFQVGMSSTSNDMISYDAHDFNSGTDGLSMSGSSIHGKESAQESLSKIDLALNTISGQRSRLGSLQNRLLSSSNNLSIYTENTSASNSRIRDVDFAEETAKVARNTVVANAGTAVMAQANTNGQAALKLLE